MKSPCLQCPRLGEDKNAGECMDCTDRLAYVAALGGMTHGVPDRLTDLLDKGDNAMVEAQANLQENATAEGLEKTVRCTRCGADLPRSAFYQSHLNKSVYMCKTCFAGYQKKLKDKKKRDLESTGKVEAGRKKTEVVVEDDATAEIAAQFRPEKFEKLPVDQPGNKTRPDVTVWIDFKSHQDLLEDLRAWAEKEFRSLEQQILFFLADVRRRNPEMNREHDR